MSIRSAAKAIIIINNMILLNKCSDSFLGEYYDLPGGGQNQYETIEEAIKRECLEETGYSVIPIKFIALCEEIYEDLELRVKYPHHSHKVFHIFLCKLENEGLHRATITDFNQVGCEWVDIKDIHKINLYPKCIPNNLELMLSDSTPRFLGCSYIKTISAV